MADLVIRCFLAWRFSMLNAYYSDSMEPICFYFLSCFYCGDRKLYCGLVQGFA